MPPLTPFTTTKVGEALRATYSSWSAKSASERIPGDPRRWSVRDVRVWLRWTVDEFSLDANTHDQFLKELSVSDKCYSVTQVVWHKVLLTLILGVPPAGGPQL